jgi:cell wall-associated NlpC family hydrolase
MTVREVAVPVATVWRSPDAPRDVDAAAVRDVPDAAAWADSMDQQVRRGLHGRAETQLLCGEPVEVVDERDGWTQVVAPWQRSSRGDHGYPGWVRTAHLGTPVDRTEGTTAYISARSAPLRVHGAVVELSFGTVLWVDAVSDTSVTVTLPGGRVGSLDRASVRLSDKADPPSHDPDATLRAARQFLGVRYLWGGTSVWGLDCSGLVHLSCRSQGVLLPRDARDQAATEKVDAVPLDQVLPGDLYFFARPGEAVYHVGFVTRPVAADGTRWMLHAPEGGELIEDAPLAAHRVATLVSAGRLCTPDTGQVSGQVSGQFSGLLSADGAD